MGEARNQIESHSGLKEDSDILNVSWVGSLNRLDEAIDEMLGAWALLTIEIHKVDYGGDVETLHTGHSLLF